MGQCMLVGECEMLQEMLEGMPATANIYKKRFCNANCEKCARLAVHDALGAGRVPSHLFPTDKDKAVKLLIETGHIREAMSL